MNSRRVVDVVLFSVFMLAPLQFWARISMPASPPNGNGGAQHCGQGDCKGQCLQLAATAQALSKANEVSNQSNDPNGHHRYSSPIFSQWEGWENEEFDYDECG